MQLDKIVAYHKALADPTRLRMLILLGEGEMNGLTLAEKLALAPATITHHAAKLRMAGLIHERRDKNTIYFSLNGELLKSHAEAAVRLIHRAAEGGVDMQEEAHGRLKESVLRNFFTKDGRLKSIPVQLKKKLIVLEHLAGRLEKGRKYEEKEINAFIKEFHDDYATIRREFIMHQYMYRENQVYELNPEPLWERWEKLS